MKQVSAKQTILIVFGDSAWHGELLRDLRNHPRYELITASSLQAARGQLTRGSVSAIVVDDSPNGAQLLREVTLELPDCVRIGRGGTGVQYVLPEGFTAATLTKLLDHRTAAEPVKPTTPTKPPPLPPRPRHVSPWVEISLANAVSAG